MPSTIHLPIEVCTNFYIADTIIQFLIDIHSTMLTTAMLTVILIFRVIHADYRILGL